MTPLANSIYKTLAFFDAQDMALTLTEVRAYLVKNDKNISPLSKIETTIQTELSNFIDHQNGFYFLKGREVLVKMRDERYRVSLQRFRKAKIFLYYLRYMPYLRAVAISGSQALLNSSQDSDIDLLVITKRNRIWLTRLLLSLYFQILQERRHGQHIKGRFCLNHYLVEDLTIIQDRNLYTAVEYASLIPVFGAEELRRFWQKNPWLREFLAKPAPEAASVFFRFQFSRLQRFWEFILDWTAGPFLNWVSGIVQKQRIKLGEYIIVSDEELSFHPGSRGQKVLAEYQRKLV